MDLWQMIAGLAIGYIAAIVSFFVIALFMGDAKVERQRREAIINKHSITYRETE